MSIDKPKETNKADALMKQVQGKLELMISSVLCEANDEQIREFIRVLQFIEGANDDDKCFIAWTAIEYAYSRSLHQHASLMEFLGEEEEETEESKESEEKPRQKTMADIYMYVWPSVANLTEEQAALKVGSDLAEIMGNPMTPKIIKDALRKSLGMAAEKAGITLISPVTIMDSWQALYRAAEKCGEEQGGEHGKE